VIRTEAAPARRGLRFGTKVVLSMLLVGLLGQGVSVLALRVSVHDAVTEQLHRDLAIGRRIWTAQQDVRLRQLLDRLLVLADDFGFKQAVATGDPPTLQSALANASGRLGAPFALLLGAQGEVRGRQLPAGADIDPQALASLLGDAQQDGFTIGVAAVAGVPVNFAIVPVFAPNLIGWVGVGVPFDQQALAEFSTISGLDAAVLLARACRAPVAIGRLDGWVPQATACAPAADQAAVHEWEEQGGRLFNRLPLSGAAGEPVYLVLASSREAAMAPFAGLNQLVLLLAAVATLLAVALALWLGRLVSRRVGVLADAAGRIRQGEYAQPLALAGGDELGELADAFNRMREGIAEREQRLLHQASHDTLTGLANREWALRRLREVLGARGSAAGAGAVLKIDIRRFKEINDLLGHGFGDRVLVAAAERLRTAVRDADVVARLGGNEFLVLLAGVEAAAAEARAARIGEQLQQPLDIDGTEIRLEIAVGCVLFPDDEADDAALVRRADIALQHAKQRGHLIERYVAGHDERHLRQLRLIGDLRHAIGRSQLELAYQPKVDVQSGRVGHAEALLRWQHAELGRVPPDEFIPLAERAGLVGSLTAYVLDAAVAQVQRWRAEGVHCGVAVNLSALDLADEALPALLLRTLQRHEVAPAELIVEVTESAVMLDLKTSLDTLHRLRRIGVRIAVDDFGTGHSSLAQLKRLPVDELKIDKSFVMTLLPGTDDEQIVQSIVQLAHALSLSVVAEGVETETGLQVLRRHGCETVQGYLFSRPLDAAGFAAWWRQRAAAVRLAAAPPATP
jgi:diguanylate cyclase (GGDEF)-like protein